MSIGFDAGTYNLVCARRNAEGKFEYRRQVNAFIELKLDNDFVFNIMQKAGVPLIKREDAKIAYALGEDAVKFAYTMPGMQLKRPMKNGCLNAGEVDAFEILNIMAHNLIGQVSKDKEILYYSVPANAINAETDVDYHNKVLEAIFRAYKSDQGFSVDARPINEAIALVYAELADKMYTGIGISCGAGMVNVAFALYGAEIFKFSIINSGDWIDQQAAKACNKDVAFINKKKTQIDLNKEPQDLVERAIKAQYELMIESTVANLKKGLQEKSGEVRIDEPVNIVVAGGTASPPGFVELFKKILTGTGNELPLAIGDVIRPEDPLYSVARGALVASENAN
jgi:actin-like ATPase involved in cell morphogenesis